MTPEQRSERARVAALASWAGLTPEQRSERARAANWGRPQTPIPASEPPPELSPQEQLQRATELATTTGGATMGAVMLITGAGPLRAEGLLAELEFAGVVTVDKYGRWVSTR